MREIVINGHRIADDEPCYTVAELGNNHCGSFDRARTMIQTAAMCGASACKLQKRDVATLYTPDMLAQPYEHEHSYGATYGAHRRALEFGAKEYLGCRAVAQQARVDFFATAFDENSADFLMEIGVPAIKIASSGLTDRRLLTHVARLGKPMIISTGGATMNDIDSAVGMLRAASASFALLHCVAAYPVHNYAELNLKVIATMRERYPDVVIGWSGHVSGIAMAVLAYAFGARIVEMHFTTNRTLKGTDHAFSLEPVGLTKVCRDLARAREATGDGVKRIYDSERAPLAKMRRTLTAFGPRVTGLMYADH